MSQWLFILNDRSILIYRGTKTIQIYNFLRRSQVEFSARQIKNLSSKRINVNLTVTRFVFKIIIPDKQILSPREHLTFLDARFHILRCVVQGPYHFCEPHRDPKPARG